MEALDEAARAETKSSAGDKYETAREMLAQARRLVEARLSGISASLENLELMAATHPEGRIGFGSLAETSHGCYLVGAGLGELEIGGSKVAAISPASPLGKVLMGRRAGDSILWRGSALEIFRIMD